MIQLRHPDIDEYPADVFPNGYPEVATEEEAAIWAAQGWERVVPADVDFRKLKVADLQRLVEQAQDAGRELSPASNKKDDLVAALEADRAETRAAEAPETFTGP